MLGLTGIVLAAGLAVAGPAQGRAAAPVQPAATAPAPAAAPTAAAAKAAAPTDPLLSQDGAPPAVAIVGEGEPKDGALALQGQVTPTGREALWFHDNILMWLISAITLFVLVLLLWVIVRYRRAANPTPSRTSHNTAIEIVWTLLPVLILIAIAVPSIRLLAAQFKPAPDNAVTLKAIGNQWYWSYEYPDNGGIQITANMLKEQSQVAAGERYRTPADGPRLLAADNRVVLPVGVPIRLITTAQDVIHSWAVPAFWIKLDAVPGKLNETSFTIEKPGLYFGVCSELCGDRHGYMPIAVEAVSPAVFAAWVHAKGGTMPGEATAASNASATAPAADAGSPGNSTGPTENATAAAVTTNQAATANPAGAGNAGN
ncbi:MAG: cytochrome c oxidase subunit II [Sphingomonas sp.]